MKRMAFIALVGTLALASCSKQQDVVGTSVKKTFTNMQLTGYTSAAGTATYVDITGGDRRTVLTLTGLKANTNYVAHYHSMGTANATEACKSGGPVVGGVIGTTVTSDANGAATIKGFQNVSDLSGAKYINVHEAAALSVVPLCAPL